MGSTVVIALNLVPLVGVFMFGWQSFELIFLYWLENVVIGAFVLLRMVVRPYGHVVEVLPLLFFAPFFTFHYGMFCFVHGGLLVSLFGPDELKSGGLLSQALLVLDAPGMRTALLALIGLQLFDWLRDTARRGLGNDSLKALMTAPYGRIVVLHLVIIGSGFALSALGDPRVGLVALVVAKTVSDLYQARKDQRASDDEPFELSEEDLALMHEEFSEPKVTVNGVDKYFDSFADLKRSKEFRLMRGVMRLMGVGDKLKIIERFIDQKIAEERSIETIAERSS